MSSSMLIMNDTLPLTNNDDKTLSNTTVSSILVNSKNETLVPMNSTKIVSTSSKKQHSNGLFDINTLVKTKYTPPAQFKFKPESSANITTKPFSLTYIPISDNFREPCNYDTCQLGKCLANGTCQCVLVRSFVLSFYFIY